MPFLLALVLFLLASPAWAEESAPVLLWGFQRGCESLTDLNKHVQRELEKEGVRPVDVLLPGSQRMSCQGASCAEQVIRECGVRGKGARILGGYVDQLGTPLRGVTRLRMWLYDTQSGQTAWLDTYCQNCPLTSTVPYNALQMLQNPQFGVSLEVTPQYCKPEPSRSERPPSSNKIFWVVYGKEHHKSVVSAAVRKLVQKTGTERPFDHVGKEYTLGVLKKVIEAEPGAQVFGAEIQDKGNIELFLFDGSTQLTQTQLVECQNCDKDDLAEKIRQAGAQLLSHCFGDDCAASGVTRARPPMEACAPFPEPQCGGRSAAQLLQTPQSTKPSGPAGPPEISPRLAKITKGALWGMFAATAVATGGLLAANFADFSQVQGQRATVTNQLLPAVGGMAGASLLSLVIAIPTTLLIDRGSPREQAVAGPTAPPSGTKQASLQCPTSSDTRSP